MISALVSNVNKNVDIKFNAHDALHVHPLHWISFIPDCPLLSHLKILISLNQFNAHDALHVQPLHWISFIPDCPLLSHLKILISLNQLTTGW